MNTFQVKKNTYSISFACSSVLDNIERIVAAVQDFIQPFRQDVAEADFNLILRELLNNAYLHGNKKDPQKIIQCTVAKKDNRLLATVIDEGAGFDWKGELNHELDIAQPGGRGIWLMRQYCSHYSFNEKGNSVTVEFSLK